LRLLENPFERRSSPDTADVNLVVFDAANHVHVDHGHGFRKRPRWILHPLSRSEQAEFFSREIHEENAALKLSALRRQQPGEFQHSRCATGIVIRAGMNLPDL